ncbi:MAG TPA: flagellin protein [Clostridiaceae bacterium]|nr:flagellin protein [Clostridiaceae bacterium]
MRINHNIAALNTYRQLSVNNTSTQKSIEKLSSGLRINRAGDDAAGLAISEKMRAQIRGLNQASRNAQDGISLIQTAEGALNETHSILQRMRELAVQAGNDTNTAADRSEIQKEINQLTSEINRIGNTTEFNTQKLLNGGAVGRADVSGATLEGGIDPDSAVQAVYEITLSGSFAADEKISFTLDGKDITVTAGAATAGTTFAVGASLDEQTTALATAVGNALTAAGIGGDWTVAQNAGKNGITITAVAGGTKDGENGNGLLSNVTGTSALQTVSSDQTTLGKDEVQEQKASGFIAFTDNLLSAGTQIVISDETFFLYDSSKGQVAPSQANVTGIDLANIDSTEALIDAIVAENAQVDNVVLSKTSTNVLTITADSATIGTAGNDIVLSVTGPAGQQNKYTADFQIGANKGQSMSIEIADMRAYALGISSLAGTSNTVTIDGVEYEVAWTSDKGVTNGTNNVAVESALSVETADDASKAVEVLDAALAKVSAERSKLGAYQNRLEHTINNLGTSAENLTAAESRIRDVDMASEMMEFTKMNILSQAAQAMLAQANQQPQGVLQLLR